MNVSVIIPAYNAAETIAETLESLFVQTYPNWEAIVVNDGSTDETVDIVTDFVKRDARFRLVNQSNMGGSAARNTGIRLARFDWMLFLDADDWILPRHLERMTEALQADPTLDAVHCGWTRVGPDGTIGRENYAPPWPDLFPVFAQRCAFQINACIVRRSLVEAVGGFDVSFRTCQDWDFWQRIARAGTRFGAVPEVLARYRSRPGSVSLNGMKQFPDSLRVITQGHSPDPRVPNPNPEHANGQPRSQLSTPKLYFASWSGGLLLGSDQDARPLLKLLEDAKDPALNPTYVAKSIFEAALLPSGLSSSGWDKLWPRIRPHVTQFLSDLEAQSQASGLTCRTLRRLERLILKNSLAERPSTIGATHAVRLEVTEPIPDIVPPPSVQRLRCEIELAGKKLGTIELPVCDGFVAGEVIVDAIAAKYTWPILGRFFEQTIYPQLRIERGPTGLSIWRGALRLANHSLDSNEDGFWSRIHDQIGWTVFLQEIWDRPEWPNEYFYDSQLVDRPATHNSHRGDASLSVEVSQDLSDVVIANDEIDVILTVGGVALGGATIPVNQNTVPAHELRVALTRASGFELCRLAVREGLIGQPLTAPSSLRTRLAAKAKQLEEDDQPVLGLEINIRLTPGLARTLKWALAPIGRGVVLGQRVSQPIGTSASRRATLPKAAALELIEAARNADEPILQVSDDDQSPARISYAPDLIGHSFLRTSKSEAATRRLANRSGDTSQATVTSKLPILLYHLVTPTRSSIPAHYQVTPELFKEQLQYLHDAGYYSINLADWFMAMKARRPLPGRTVLITFDGGEADFLTYAWPWLEQYGFSATVFLTAGEVGRFSHWYRNFGEEIPGLAWQELRQLQDSGVEFGSYSLNHRPLTALSVEDVVREGTRSRLILEQGLGARVQAFAYPYGDVDRIVQHLIGACGYVFGLSRRSSLSTFENNLLVLPRIRVSGSDRLQQFIKKLDP